jgi:hypothetical protein
MTWTRFMDMHSGGSQKEDFAKLYIEAPRAEALAIFYNRFGHNPERVTCTCCGDDYSISESETLEQATAYDRGCGWSEETGGYVEEPPTNYRAKYETYVPLDTYVAAGVDTNAMMSQIDKAGKTVKPKVAFIFAKDIKPKERAGSVPEQGYVWVD